MLDPSASEVGGVAPEAVVGELPPVQQQLLPSPPSAKSDMAPAISFRSSLEEFLERSKPGSAGADLQGLLQK
eukprot:11742664-Alexandrium_andersonii.AAC.1